VTYACTCSAPPVNEARTQADVVFRGTIIALRPSMKPASPAWGHDTQKIAVFRVSRVWKGEVGHTFEMPAIEETSGCTGFWPDQLKIGNDLLVYAYGKPGEADGGGFITTICSRTWFANKTKDFDELGAGHEPRSPFYLFWVMGIAFLAVLVSYIVRSRMAQPLPRISTNF
jgi:hypothetical protein